MIIWKNVSYSLFEKTFRKNSYHIETSQLIYAQISWLVSMRYNFLLKGVSEQAIILFIITVLYNCGVLKYGEMVEVAK